MAGKKNGYGIRDYLDVKFSEVDLRFDGLSKDILNMIADTEKKFDACRVDCDLKIKNKSLNNKLWIIVPAFFLTLSAAAFLYSTFVIIPTQQHIKIENKK